MSLLKRLASVASTLLRNNARRSPDNLTASGESDTRQPSSGHSGSGQSGPAHSGSDTAAAPTSGRSHETVEFVGQLPRLAYTPQADEHADPGEVVWAWVPYEENDGRGKDRPVLVLARHAGGFLGLQATSKDHDRDRADEERWGRHWIDIGRGDWDSRGRESELRLDRVLLMPADAVRREGAALDRERFEVVVAALQALRSQAN